MAAITYKCPNCGGGLIFEPKSQKYHCEFCLSDFTEEEMEKIQEKEQEKEEKGGETGSAGAVYLSQLRRTDCYRRYDSGHLLLLLSQSRGTGRASDRQL